MSRATNWTSALWSKAYTIVLAKETPASAQLLPLIKPNCSTGINGDRCLGYKTLSKLWTVCVEQLMGGNYKGQNGNPF